MPGIQKTMKEFKSGKLHSGSKKGPVVSNKKQAIAIAMSSKKRKAPSESDMGSMKGYDPNLGVGKAGMKQTLGSTIRNIAKPAQKVTPMMKTGLTGLASMNMNSSSLGGKTGSNANSTLAMAKRKVQKKMGNVKSVFKK